MKRKADYRRIAETYDAARPIPEENLRVWIDLISETVGARKARLLDLGCGTGRFSIPIAERLGYSVTGADKSEEMLAKARMKPGAEPISWDVQDAESLTYGDGSFDAVFMSHLLHHVDEPPRVLRESYRVLRPGGVFLDRWAPIEHIRDDPEHRFFPETIAIDEARVPTLDRLEAWLREAGFVDVSSRTLKQHTYSSARERLGAARLGHTSVLGLVPELALDRGLNFFRRYVDENPNDPWILKDLMTLTTGRRPRKGGGI